MTTMKSRLVRIGSSRGVRLPKAVIAEAGLAEDIELQVRGNTVVISSRRTTRVGWAEAARRMRETDEDRLRDNTNVTRPEGAGLRAQRPSRSVGQAFAELRSLAARSGHELDLPRRRNRQKKG